jgi:hypothetical protein
MPSKTLEEGLVVQQMQARSQKTDEDQINPNLHPLINQYIPNQSYHSFLFGDWIYIIDKGNEWIKLGFEDLMNIFFDNPKIIVTALIYDNITKTDNVKMLRPYLPPFLYQAAMFSLEKHFFEVFRENIINLMECESTFKSMFIDRPACAPWNNVPKQIPDGVDWAENIFKQTDEEAKDLMVLAIVLACLDKSRENRKK